MEFDINFDKASKEWRKNKIKKSNGCFAYKCVFINSEKQKSRNSKYSSPIKNKYNLRSATIKTKNIKFTKL